MTERASTFGSSAYGGDGWSPRQRSLADELGTVWAACGMDNEWNTLRSVLVHRPGVELEASTDPKSVQMLEPIDVVRAGDEHDAMSAAFESNGVCVHRVDPAVVPPPNQMFCADLMFATPEGVILARPASTVRAGEERQVARRLADLGVPIVRTIGAEATFEGADAAWLDTETVVVGRGVRTNSDGIDQIAETLLWQDVDVLDVDMPFGTMHLMGMLRIVDRNLAVAWPRRTPYALVIALRERDYEVVFLPEVDEYDMNRAMNFVTLGPRHILMESGYRAVQSVFESAQIECVTVEATELIKAAGGFGCLTGVLQRDAVGS